MKSFNDFENNQGDHNLKSCPECGHLISKLAKTCPNCGHPIYTNTDNTGCGHFMIIFAAVLLALVIFSLFGKFNVVITG